MNSLTHRIFMTVVPLLILSCRNDGVSPSVQPPPTQTSGQITFQTTTPQGNPVLWRISADSGSTPENLTVSTPRLLISLPGKSSRSNNRVARRRLADVRFPCRHWKSLRTSNPIESLFSAVKPRIKAARWLRTRMSAVCLAFQVLKHSERRIRRINGYTIVA
jgi:hypothetical protein